MTCHFCPFIVVVVVVVVLWWDSSEWDGKERGTRFNLGGVRLGLRALSLASGFQTSGFTNQNFIQTPCHNHSTSF
jgi:hypothetical protein